MSTAGLKALPGLLTAGLVLAACASGPPPGPPGPRTTLFISPFGEPFLSELGQPWPSADWLLGADENLDGAVTLEEFAADGTRVFGRLDLDGDRRLDHLEIAAYEQDLRRVSALDRSGPEALGGGRRPPPRGPGEAPPRALADPQDRPGGGAGGPPGGGAGGPGRPRPARGPQGYGIIAEAGFFNLPQPVKAADVNVDQRVTAEEWATATERWFMALDTDRDGRLRPESLPRTPLQIRLERSRR